MLLKEAKRKSVHWHNIPILGRGVHTKECLNVIVEPLINCEYLDYVEFLYTLKYHFWM